MFGLATMELVLLLTGGGLIVAGLGGMIPAYLKHRKPPAATATSPKVRAAVITPVVVTPRLARAKPPEPVALTVTEIARETVVPIIDMTPELQPSADAGAVKALPVPVRSAQSWDDVRVHASVLADDWDPDWTTPEQPEETSAAPEPAIASLNGYDGLEEVFVELHSLRSTVAELTTEVRQLRSDQRARRIVLKEVIGEPAPRKRSVKQAA